MDSASALTPGTTWQAVRLALSFALLDPHVYLDTVGLLGATAAVYDRHLRLEFVGRPARRLSSGSTSSFVSTRFLAAGCNRQEDVVFSTEASDWFCCHRQASWLRGNEQFTSGLRQSFNPSVVRAFSAGVRKSQSDPVGKLREFLTHFLDPAPAERRVDHALRSFFRYAALEAPGHAGLIQRVLAIPNQRQPRAMVDFLTRPEIDALLAVPNRETWLGRRDHAFLLKAVQTGLRLSEMTALRHEDVSLGAGAHVHCHGKGRKERCTPLAKPTVAVLKALDTRTRQRRLQDSVSQTRGGG